jgi:ATP-dependent helicase HrpB
MPQVPLPIDSVLPSLLEALSAHACVVLRAPPGAGKTTRVPPAMEQASGMLAGQLWMLEPRRMAARSAARRISDESGTSLGEYAGYQVRFDRRVTPSTRIVVATEGILLRQLQNNPLLDGVGAVVFDEFHERHLDADLALAMVNRVRTTFREDLKLVVMSATLDPGPLSSFLGDCPVIDSPGRLYPVELKYAPASKHHRMDESVVQAVERTLPRTSGDILVFLPGVGEIFSAQRALEPLARRETLDVMPLYGDLDPSAQDQVLRPSVHRKVVLSTNVAETSVTIEGITAVIDTGQARVMQFDPQVGLDRLELTPISKASAEQRAGRAGRLEPGVCVRLWPESSQRHRPEQERSEIQRVDLASSVLQLFCWGEKDLEQFPWFEPPRQDSIDHARQLLERLGAIQAGQVTEIGRQMSGLPVHPRLARLLLEGQRYGVASRVALVAALLSERDPFRQAQRSFQQRRPLRGTKGVVPPTRGQHRSDSDVLDRLIALEDFREHGITSHPMGNLHAGSARHLLKVAEELIRSLDRVSDAMDENLHDSDHRVLRCLLAAFPDRLARRREQGSPRGLMVGGKGVKMGPQSAVHEARLFLCIDVDGASSDAVVRLASAVDDRWLDPGQLRDQVELFFHPTRKEVQARRRLCWEDLALSEVPVATPDSEESSQLLFQNALKSWQQIFPQKDAELTSLLTRVGCLNQWLPDLQLPKLSDEGLHEVLRDLCGHCRSFEQLKRADWVGAIRGRLTYEQTQMIDREAPETWQSPQGRRFKIQYELGAPPVLAARIQDLFGLNETPRIARNTVPLLIHMLAPNMRPQQVTNDLQSFWKNTYGVIRKELRGRYPKHAWPEDPTQV